MSEMQEMQEHEKVSGENTGCWRSKIWVRARQGGFAKNPMRNEV